MSKIVLSGLELLNFQLQVKQFNDMAMPLHTSNLRFFFQFKRQKVTLVLIFQSEQTSRRKQEEKKLIEKQERLLNDTQQKWQVRYTVQQKQRDLKSLEMAEKEQLKKRIQVRL